MMFDRPKSANLILLSASNKRFSGCHVCMRARRGREVSHVESSLSWQYGAGGRRWLVFYPWTYLPTLRSLCTIWWKWQYSTPEIIWWKKRRASSALSCSVWWVIGWRKRKKKQRINPMSWLTVWLPLWVTYPSFRYDVIKQFSIRYIFHHHKDVRRRINHFIQTNDVRMSTHFEDVNLSSHFLPHI